MAQNEFKCMVMNMKALIEDYIKRAKWPLTVDEVLADMIRGITFHKEEGFLVLSRDNKDLHVVHCYVRPGAEKLFDEFIAITDETARYLNCRAVLFTTMRPRGFSKALGKHGYKSTPAVIFQKEVQHGQRQNDNCQE